MLLRLNTYTAITTLLAAYMRDNTSIQMITASIDLEEVRKVQLEFGTQEAKAEQDNSTVEGGTVQPKKQANHA